MVRVKVSGSKRTIRRIGRIVRKKRTVLSKRTKEAVKEVIKREVDTKQLFVPGDETFSGFIGFGTAAQWENYNNSPTHSFTNIGQGTNESQRIADKVSDLRLKINAQFFCEAGNAPSVDDLDAPQLRILIVQLKRGVQPNDLTTLMNTANYGFMTNLADDPTIASRCYILKDKQIRFDRQVAANYDSTSTAPGFFMAPVHMVKTFIVKPKIGAEWAPTTTGVVMPDLKGAICMLLYYNNVNVIASATPRQFYYKVGYTLKYKDN